MKKLSGREHLVAVAASHLQQSSQVPVENWCRRRDLNPHGLRHTPLKRACLPFHHFGLGNAETSPRLRSWSRLPVACRPCSVICRLPGPRIRAFERCQCDPIVGRLRGGHYRSRPKSLSINGLSGNIGRLLLAKLTQYHARLSRSSSVTRSGCNDCIPCVACRPLRRR